MLGVVGPECGDTGSEGDGVTPCEQLNGAAEGEGGLPGEHEDKLLTRDGVWLPAAGAARLERNDEGLELGSSIGAEAFDLGLGPPALESGALGGADDRRGGFGWLLKEFGEADLQAGGYLFK